ncbi:MAG TPA: LacI family DNA-binding transcriptional regulator, partial [Armatimonadota bacterium]|nr:LacI family DNA-binding transcriptional regulator [Armatimonadota bacterium]
MRRETESQQSGQSEGRVTRHDVARVAGVSLTTVTHSLNPTPGSRVSEETRQRVQRIAHELGYRPNFIGRALVEGKSYTIGFLQPSYDSIFNDYYQRIMRGMALAMEPDDYHLLALFRSPDYRYLKVVTQGRVDGMIILQSDFDTDHIEQLIETGIPTVVVNRRFPVEDTPQLGCIHADHQQLMYDIVDEFVTLGCRTVLHVNDFYECDANALLMEGFTKAMARYAATGIVGSTMIPDKHDFAKQIRTAFIAGQRW